MTAYARLVVHLPDQAPLELVAAVPQTAPRIVVRSDSGGAVIVLPVVDKGGDYRVVATRAERDALPRSKRIRVYVEADDLEYRLGPDLQTWVAIEGGEGGVPGPEGPAGHDGAPGQDGRDGADGLSAYELARASGYGGTLEVWLASLTGPQGLAGNDGAPGAPGRDGVDGAPGSPGRDGTDGTPGRDGVDGAPGVPGLDGADGLSAYELAKASGYQGTLEAWLASLVGPQGDPGQKGDKGDPGATTFQGLQGAPSDNAALAEALAAKASLEHASRHALGAADWISPHAIGAPRVLGCFYGLVSFSVANSWTKVCSIKLPAGSFTPCGFLRIDVGFWGSLLTNTTSARAYQVKFGSKDPNGTDGTVGNTYSYARAAQRWPVLVAGVGSSQKCTPSYTAFGMYAYAPVALTVDDAADSWIHFLFLTAETREVYQFMITATLEKS